MVWSPAVRQILRQAISEADQSRREFLRRSGAGVVASLINGGVPPSVVTQAVAGKPILAIVNLGIGWDMYRGEHEDLAATSSKLNLIYNYLKKMGVQVYGTEAEDAGVNGTEYKYFLELNTDILNRLKGSIRWVEGEEGEAELLLPGSNNLAMSLVDDDDIPGFSSGLPVTNPVLDFWNQYARLDGDNAARNIGWVNKLKAEFGDSLKKPLLSGRGYDFEEVGWDELDNYARDGHLVDDDQDDDYDDYDEQYAGDDDYDERLKSQWSTDGGFTESVQCLYNRIRDRDITLNEALDWVKTLRWPADSQQQLAIRFIRRTLID